MGVYRLTNKPYHQNWNCVIYQGYHPPKKKKWYVKFWEWLNGR